MNDHFTRPKRFGEILDQTFRLSKQYFSTFFLILLILAGPLVLLEALVLLLTGTSLVREVASGTSFLEQITNTVYENAYEPTSIGQDLGYVVIGIASIILYPIAYAAIFVVMDGIRKQQELTAGAAIKRAFSRFWPIFASALLMGVIFFAMFFVGILVSSLLMGVGVVFQPVVGITIGVLLFLGIFSVIIFFAVRWGLFLPAVTFERCAPGISRSWHLTRRNFWRTLGLFFVLILITLIINAVFEMVLVAFLGSSVMYSVLLNLITFVTTIFFVVGYGLIYFDLKLRNDGDDLMELMENYESPNA